MDFLISRLAELDIIEIGHYTAKTWGLPQSNAYLTNLFKSFNFIIQNPEIGKSCSEVRQGYRKYNQGKHIIFYRISNNSNNIVEIIRILHQNVDIEQNLQ